MKLELNKIIQGNCVEVLKTLPDESIDCIITSPPYFGLRDYGTKEQIGLEATPAEFVEALVVVFSECKRVLKNEGTLWLNLGDSYAGSGKGQTREGSNDPKRGKTKGMKLKNSSKGFDGIKAKDLIGIPWRVAFALQADGWYLRQDIIWAKPNPMPESVTDRCTKAHEYIFLMTKSPKYHFDADAIKEKSVYDDPRMVDGFVLKSVNGKHANDPQNAAHRKKFKPTEAGGGSSMLNHSGYFKGDGTPIGNPGFRNKRDVWSVTVSPFRDAHFATFPESLIEPMVKAGCPRGGAILDPFMGAGTTGVVAKKLLCNYVGIELNPEYIKIAEARIKLIPTSLFA